ncbi:Dixin, partial [Sarracenia purpurea var. burkii]
MEGQGRLVMVNPNPNKGLTSKTLDWLEKQLIVKHMYGSSQPQPHRYLSGNFAPVLHETPPCKDLSVKGYLP